MCAPKAPPAPEAIDPAQSSGEYLFGKDFGEFQGMTDPALQKRLIESEREFRPQYAELNLQDLESYLFGSEGQQGLVDQSRRAGQEMEADRAGIASSQRESDISDVEALGGRATTAFRASDPYTQELIDDQRALSQGVYARAQGVTPQQQRMAEQQAREAYGARGRQEDNASIAAEILGREEFQRGNRAEASQVGGQTLGMFQATAADPFQAILGRPAQNQGQSLAAQGQGMLGQSSPQLFNPDVGVNLAMQQNANEANYNANIYGAQAARSGAMWGGLFSGIGSALGG